MTSTPKSLTEEILGESWVELGPAPSPLPFLPSEEHLRLLREAQRESNQSSARDSPKSPPNSPNTEPIELEGELSRGVYINRDTTDWIWDWSSRPDSAPPKDWKFRHPGSKSIVVVVPRKGYSSMRHAKVGRNGLFSKEVLYTLFLTNFISLLLGTGLGVWLTRRGGISLPTRITFE